jgi:imidazolonepropionase-like amidohydrolase
MFKFTGGTAYLDGGFKSGVDVLTKGKRIERVGRDIETPKGCKVVRLSSGQFLVPGLIDAHTHLGLFEDGVGQIGIHGNEFGDPNTAYVRAMDAVFPKDMAFEDARRNGVVAVGAFPGSANLFGGMCAVIRTYGETLEDMLIDGYHGMKMALGENPFRVYSSQNKSPNTRMASAGLIRKILIDTQNYLAKKDAESRGSSRSRGKRKKDDKGKSFEKDLSKEHLGMLLERKIPARFHVHRRDDIETAIRLSEEFKFNLVLDHCTEGWLIPEFIAKRKLTAVIGPMDTGRVKYELKNRDERSPFTLNKAGVNVCLMTDHPIMPVHNLRFCAALAVRGGCSDEEAMSMMTQKPAKLLNIDKDYGSISKGKLACLAIYSGHPLDMRSRVEHVWIEGEEYC